MSNNTAYREGLGLRSWRKVGAQGRVCRARVEGSRWFAARARLRGAGMQRGGPLSLWAEANGSVL